MHTTSSGNPSIVKFSPNCPRTKSAPPQLHPASSDTIRSGRRKPLAAHLRGHPNRPDHLHPDSVGQPDSGHAQDLSRSRCVSCDPSIRCSRGTPTFTDRSRAHVARSVSTDLKNLFNRVAARCRAALKGRLGGDHLGKVKVAIRAVRNHRLARFEMQLRAIEMHRNNVWLERYEVGDTADLRIGIEIRPSCLACLVRWNNSCRGPCTGRRSGASPERGRTHRCRRVERTSAARSRTRRGPAAAWYRRWSGRHG